MGFGAVVGWRGEVGHMWLVVLGLASVEKPHCAREGITQFVTRIGVLGLYLPMADAIVFEV